jgi:hypothetical protein
MSFSNFSSRVRGKKVSLSAQWLYAIAAALPWLPKGQKYVAVLIPPIRSMRVVESAIFVAAVLVTWWILSLNEKRIGSRAFRIVVPLVLGILVISQTIFWLAFVHTQEVVDCDKSFTVLVGYERKPEAKAAYGDKTDAEIIEGEGAYDDAVDRVWTRRSVLINRSIALGLYGLAVAAFTCMISEISLREKGSIDAPEISSGED